MIKWMAVLEEKHEKFIREAIKKAAVDGKKANGSLIIREALNKAMNDSGDFINSLANAGLRSRLERLAQEKQRLEDEEKRIKAALK